MHVDRALGLAPALLLGALLLLGSGCASLSARHLERTPWSLEPSQRVEMRFWRFTYDILVLPDRYGVRGAAYPREVPEWAAWAQELWFEAYLCDADGRVLARDSRVYQPRALDRDRGVEFEFVLKPFPGRDLSKLFLTFGYHMKLTDRRSGQDEPAPTPRVFYAGESAASR
jgi:hypothetical protein